VSGFLDINGSPGYISGLGQGLIADAQELVAGIEKFRASVKDPTCFGDDEAGHVMKANYPSGADIDDNCAMQTSSADSTEALGHGLGQVLGMLDDVVKQGEKNVKNTKRDP
jgi:hypothetical protein